MPPAAAPAIWTWPIPGCESGFGRGKVVALVVRVDEDEEWWLCVVSLGVGAGAAPIWLVAGSFGAGIFGFPPVDMVVWMSMTDVAGGAGLGVAEGAASED